MSLHRINCHDKTKGRRQNECCDVANFVAKKADKSSQKVCRDNNSFVATPPIEINSARQGKNVATFKTLSRQL